MLRSVFVAISLAGHLGLDNLILIYDNNSVTVDGNIDSCFSEDTSAKLKAQGWHVIEIDDGSNDVSCHTPFDDLQLTSPSFQLAAILEGLDQAKALKGKPVLVNIKTVIGHSSKKQNTGAVHGAALGDEDVRHVKESLGFNPEDKFVIPPKVYDYFQECKPKGAAAESEWNKTMEQYAQKYPEEYKQLQLRLAGKFAEDNWRQLLPEKNALPTAPQPTRKSSGIAVQALVPKYNSFISGSADLMESTFVNFKDQVDFQNVSHHPCLSYHALTVFLLQPESGLGDYTGRQIRWGIREHAMIGTANGYAAYQKGMFIPIASTFFMFWLYAAPAVRMSALQGLRFIGIATHDSIGIGEDGTSQGSPPSLKLIRTASGPTHQPIALGAFYRALPNINLIRPADAEEVMGAWQIALDDQNANTPSLFTLSRQAVPLLEGTDRHKMTMGAYVVYGQDIEPELTIVSTGAEVARAIETAKILSSTKKVRVVSMPSQKHFDAQSLEYRQSVLPTSSSLVVAVEAWGSYGWARYAHASLSMHTFGYSAPQEQMYEKFGFKPDNMASKIDAWVHNWQGQGRLPAVGEFEELLLGYAQH